MNGIKAQQQIDELKERVKQLEQRMAEMEFRLGRLARGGYEQGR